MSDEHVPTSKEILDGIYAQLGPIHKPGYDQAAAMKRVKQSKPGSDDYYYNRQPPPDVSAAESVSLPLIWARDATPMLDCDYVVKGLLDRRGLGLIYGPTSCGKTFLAIDMLLHVAAGLPWRGRRVRRSLVYYIAAESGAGLQRRVYAWLERHKQNGKAVPFVIRPRGVAMLDETAVSALVQEIKTLPNADKLPIVIAVDTVSRSMSGGDENRDLPQFVSACDRLRDEVDATTIAVHHSGKDRDRGARGHSSLPAAVDMSLAVDDEGERAAVVEKARDGKIGTAFPFSLTVVELGTDAEGDTVTTCVVEHSEDNEAPTKRPRVAVRGLSAGATLVLQAIRDATAMHGQHGASVEQPGVPADVRTVALGHARDSHKRLYGDRDADSKRGDRACRIAFSRGLDDLVARGLVAMSGSYAWQVPPT